MSHAIEVHRPRIAISANRMAPVWDRRFYIGKSLQYAEDGLLQYVWRHGGLPVMVPVIDLGHEREMAANFDALILSGGLDISPTLYGEQARRPEWAGDPFRDKFEIGLVQAFTESNKPVFGVCRGHQLINVALGGSLFQDIIEDGAVERLHRDPEPYDKLSHHLHIDEGSYLHHLYGVTEAMVNTVHHQAVRDVARGLEVMAHSDDGVVEAFKHTGHRYMVGVQWHPEWIDPEQVDGGFLPPGPLMDDFIKAARESSEED